MDFDRPIAALLDRQVRNNPRLAECSTNNVLREVSARPRAASLIDGQFSTLLVRDNSKTGRPSCKWDPTSIAPRIACARVHLVIDASGSRAFE